MSDTERRWRELIIPSPSAGMRIDVFLSNKFPDWSRAAVSRAIRTGEVRSNRHPRLKPSTLLQEGETLSLAGLKGAPTAPPPPLPPVLYEDSDLIAFSKPPDMLCHPTGRIFAWGLINVARLAYPDEPLDLAHRLDRETSGVILLTRRTEARMPVKEAFRQRLVKKTYWALVRGEVPWERQLVDAPLGPDPRSPIRLKQAVIPDGAPAVTHIRRLATWPGLSLVSCRPLTGRTHQIRVHLDFVGHPILGDKIYGQDPSTFLSLAEKCPLPDLVSRLGHPRQCLHARGLHLPHPKGHDIHLRAPLPADMLWVIHEAIAGRWR